MKNQNWIIGGIVVAIGILGIAIYYKNKEANTGANVDSNESQDDKDIANLLVKIDKAA